LKKEAKALAILKGESTTRVVNIISLRENKAPAI